MSDSSRAASPRRRYTSSSGSHTRRPPRHGPAAARTSRRRARGCPADLSQRRHLQQERGGLALALPPRRPRAGSPWRHASFRGAAQLGEGHQGPHHLRRLLPRPSERDGPAQEALGPRVARPRRQLDALPERVEAHAVVGAPANEHVQERPRIACVARDALVQVEHARVAGVRLRSLHQECERPGAVRRAVEGLARRSTPASTVSLSPETPGPRASTKARPGRRGPRGVRPPGPGADPPDRPGPRGFGQAAEGPPRALRRSPRTPPRAGCRAPPTRRRGLLPQHGPEAQTPRHGAGVISRGAGALDGACSTAA